MRRYTGMAVTLHWLIAAGVITQFALGWQMIEIPKSPPGVRADYYNLHKSIGLTLGLLVVVRLAWRLGHPVPSLPSAVPAWQRRIAVTSHVALYVCMVLMPLSGYLGSSFTRYPIRYWGITLPHWGWDAPVLKNLCSSVHQITVYVFMSLVVLHILAALKHLLVDRDDVFWRIWPMRPLRTRIARAQH